MLVAQLRHATAVCERRGARLTPLRRQVLTLVLDSPRPVGAYDLLAQLRIGRPRAAPPTIYRALDFLIEHGLIHRVERLSAFVGCPNGHAPGLDHDHAAQFLICGTCGTVTELEDQALRHALEQAAYRQGFTVATATIEAEGRCRACTP